MKISVLVPVYGVEKYIARCAESLFGQTYADLEFVFVDDCTPDHSIDVLRSVMARYPARQAQVRIIHNEKNSGIGAVRQKLIDSCTGDCLTFVDSDDYMPLDAISLLAAGMERSGADMVDGGWQRVTRDGISAVNKPYQGGDERHYLGLLLCQKRRSWPRLPMIRTAPMTSRAPESKKPVFPVSPSTATAAPMKRSTRKMIPSFFFMHSPPRK